MPAFDEESFLVEEAEAEAATKPVYSQDYTTAMAHFYRGEVGRIMVWRQRLDTTTTWAITSTGTIFTVAFSFSTVPHLIFFFNLAIVLMMLWIEARRYRFYDAFRARVRMLEAHFLMPVLMQEKPKLEGNWRKLVAEDLLVPAFKISIFESIGRRLKRNYAFIITIVLTAWITKILIHGDTINSLGTFYKALQVGAIPSWFVAMVMSSTFLCVAGITWYIARNSTGEITEVGKSSRTNWLG
ncbi:MAG: integral membrane-like protein [Verrucomicrobiales bacterium]|nr:integral membrane-like protein [Verrucomicrobiales bacterium]